FRILPKQIRDVDPVIVHDVLLCLRRGEELQPDTSHYDLGTMLDICKRMVDCQLLSKIERKRKGSDGVERSSEPPDYIYYAALKGKDLLYRMRKAAGISAQTI